MKLSQFALASVLAIGALGTSNAWLSGCPKNLAFQLTNVLQAGQIQFPYAKCEENSGEYVAGIARFSTKDGSLWKVINAYHKITGGDDVFSKYDNALKKRTSSSSNSLDGFCDAWESVGTDQKFWSAQGSVFESDYFDPSQEMADDLGLKLSITKAQLYDTAIAHGAGSGSSELGGMVEKTNSQITKDISGNSASTLKINNYKVDEVEWLKLFLTTRAKYKDVHGAKASIDSYTYMINRKETKWGDTIYVLNDKGDEGDVTCDNSYNPYPTPDQDLGATATTSSTTTTSKETNTDTFDPYNNDNDNNDDDDDDGYDNDKDNDNGDGNTKNCHGYGANYTCEDGTGENNPDEENCHGYGANYTCDGNSKFAFGFGLLAGVLTLLAI
ncbi:hypothetical protein IWW36_004120 [Coemansia brasiliensis]|uniref:Chitosanase n=1 Tax=Coemansia brasiliensis TaxID=2650707 RepID=A0A9W8I6I5_9FUNG|nr:hypothetical protein IWW36_004120 [Coemansia brasiliensis]